MTEEEARRPILYTIRQILRFKDTTTIQEIAQYAGVTKLRALEVINQNGHLVPRHRDSGKITQVTPRETLREQMKREGRYWWLTELDYGSTAGLAFEGHADLKESLSKKTTGGGWGDSYEYSYVPDTDDNKALLAQAGCLPWDDLKGEIDDRLWQE